MKWLYSEVGDRCIWLYLPLFYSLSVSSCLVFLRVFTLFQTGDLNSKLLVCDCRNKYQQWMPITFEIHLLVFTVIMPIWLSSMTKAQQYFMPEFSNHWICKSVAIVLWVIFHLCTLTTTAPWFPLVSNTETACENYFSCHIRWHF